MNRRATVLNELGLAPLWVRREQLAAWQEAANSATAAEAAPAERTAPHQTTPAVSASEPSFTPLAQAAHHKIEAQLEHAPSTISKAPSQGAAAIHQVLQARKPGHTQTSNPVPAQLETPLDERASAIAQMNWAELQQAIRDCTACKLCQTRTNTVFGVGDPQAKLVVVGEAPGAEEDAQGEPFVGKAGKLLDNMLASIGQRRGDGVFIANVLKCRPPGNRNPQADEVAQCAPFLHRQLELIAPKVLFASGRFAISNLLQDDAPISALRGKVHQYRQLPVVVSYHPAYLLRNMPDKAKAWRDLLLLKTTLEK
ncbi:uracil-DNA glycosylase [Chitinibacter tainanensis]|uniref:uracil-DNA glycosylase n=1 Tax=Chitinibacter tainanensis TaxID=230667 RepID=UPI00041DA61C|nr:uracil-DNA glycosylase [Chitinibacter tainanensis]